MAFRGRTEPDERTKRNPVKMARHPDRRVAAAAVGRHVKVADDFRDRGPREIPWAATEGRARDERSREIGTRDLSPPSGLDRFTLRSTENEQNEKKEKKQRERKKERNGKNRGGDETADTNLCNGPGRPTIVSIRVVEVNGFNWRPR